MERGGGVPGAVRVSRLLPDKRKQMYRDLFMQINAKCQNFGLEFNPQKIRLDFESALYI